MPSTDTVLNYIFNVLLVVNRCTDKAVKRDDCLEDSYSNVIMFVIMSDELTSFSPHHIYIAVLLLNQTTHSQSWNILF